jgi:heme/copper-type cytochrome/quinol oxidase subunit 2
VRDTFFWFAVLSCAVGQTMIIRSALRDPAPPMSGDAASSVPRPRRGTEIAWTMIPAVMLAATLAFTWSAMHSSQTVAAPHTHRAVRIPT